MQLPGGAAASATTGVPAWLPRHPAYSGQQVGKQRGWRELQLGGRAENGAEAGGCIHAQGGSSSTKLRQGIPLHIVHSPCQWQQQQQAGGAQGTRAWHRHCHPAACGTQLQPVLHTGGGGEHSPAGPSLLPGVRATYVQLPHSHFSGGSPMLELTAFPTPCCAGTWTLWRSRGSFQWSPGSCMAGAEEDQVAPVWGFIWWCTNAGAAHAVGSPCNGGDPAGLGCASHPRVQCWPELHNYRRQHLHWAQGTSPCCCWQGLYAMGRMWGGPHTPHSYLAPTYPVVPLTHSNTPPHCTTCTHMHTPSPHTAHHLPVLFPSPHCQRSS